MRGCPILPIGIAGVFCLAGGITAQDAVESLGKRFDEAFSQARALQASDAGAEAIRAAHALALNHYLQCDPEGSVAVRRRRPAALAALGAGRPGLAAEWFAQLLASTPVVDPEVVYGLVRARLAAGAGGAALEQAYELSSRSAEASSAVRGALADPSQLALAAADGLLQRGRLEIALWAFLEIAEAQERSPVALANLALAYRRVGRVEDAMACYQEALSKTPGDPLLWNDYGLLLRGMGRRAEAVEAFRRAVAVDVDPAMGPALGNLAALGEGTASDGGVSSIAAIAQVLRVRPDAGRGFARRVCLDLLLAGTRGSAGQPPDSSALGR